MVHTSQRLTFVVIYRPPNTNCQLFFEEFTEYLESFDHSHGRVFISGDFNVWMDDVHNQHRNDFTVLLESFHYVNKVNAVTSRSGHMLDLVLCDAMDGCVTQLDIEPDFTVSPYHKLINYAVNVFRNVKIKKTISFRLKSNYDPQVLLDNVLDKLIVGAQKTCPHSDCNGVSMASCLVCLVHLYNTTLLTEYSSMCPIVTKDIKVKDNTPWFNTEIKNVIRIRKLKEKRWRRLRTVDSRSDYISTKNIVNKLIRKQKCTYREKVPEAGSNPKILYSILNSVIGSNKNIIKGLPGGHSDTDLANKL